MYVKHLKNGFVTLSIYVDDILLAGNDMKLIDITKRWLSSNFKMRDMGEASYMLGIRDFAKRLLGLSQETYIKNMLEHQCMHDYKLMDTPIKKIWV